MLYLYSFIHFEYEQYSFRYTTLQNVVIPIQIYFLFTVRKIIMNCCSVLFQRIRNLQLIYVQNKSFERSKCLDLEVLRLHEFDVPLQIF